MALSSNSIIAWHFRSFSRKAPADRRMGNGPVRSARSSAALATGDGEMAGPPPSALRRTCERRDRRRTCDRSTPATRASGTGTIGASLDRDVRRSGEREGRPANLRDPSPASQSRGRPQQALGDHVALDLAGATGDRQAPVAEEAADPQGGGRVTRRAGCAEQLEADLLHPLVVLDAEQLAGRSHLGPGAAPASARSVIRVPSAAKVWAVATVSPSVSGDHGVVEAAGRLGECEQGLDAGSHRRTRSHRHPLVAQRRACRLPATGRAADHALVGHEHVGEEHLV